MTSARLIFALALVAISTGGTFAQTKPADDDEASWRPAFDRATRFQLHVAGERDALPALIESGVLGARKVPLARPPKRERARLTPLAIALTRPRSGV